MSPGFAIGPGISRKVGRKSSSLISPAGSDSLLWECLACALCWGSISWSPSVGHSRGEVGTVYIIMEVQLGAALAAEVFEPYAGHVILLVSCVCWNFRCFNSWLAVIRKDK